MLKPFCTGLVFASLLIGCGGAEEDSSSTDNSTDNAYLEVAAPANFDFSMQTNVDVTVTVLLPDGSPNTSAAVFVYEDTVDVALPTDDSLVEDEVDDTENDEVFVDPTSLLVQGITNSSGMFNATIQTDDAQTTLVVTTSAIGIPNIEEATITDGTVSVTFSAD